MSRFESGVKRYIDGTVTVTIHFPVDFKDHEYVACEYCKLYSRSSRRCYLTGEILPFPEKYVGEDCPLRLEDRDERDPIAESE